MAGRQPRRQVGEELVLVDGAGRSVKNGASSASIRRRS
jgi:flagellar biosynthesis GTPase FlhF